MMRVKKFLKDKYVIASLIFFIYTLFLDDIDIFTIVNQKQKLNKLSSTQVELQTKLDSTKTSLSKVNNKGELEHFAREKKLFKKENEEIFVISYE
jgi:cell division protein DivIC